MKSAMPFFGIAAPALKLICREAFATYPFADAQTWREDVLAIWRDAERREERYAALALTGHRKAKPFQTLDALPMYEEMIVSGAWWDFVDEIAANRIGPLVRAYPKEMRATMLTWSIDDDLWRRRTSILCQLKFGEATDLELLYACIEPSIASKEFFLRKAIGWALRQVARHAPDEVRKYVREHENALSGLSKREALKHIG